MLGQLLGKARLFQQLLRERVVLQLRLKAIENEHTQNNVRDLTHNANSQATLRKLIQFTTYISLAWAACGDISLGSFSMSVTISWRILLVRIDTPAPITPPTAMKQPPERTALLLER